MIVFVLDGMFQAVVVDNYSFEASYNYPPDGCRMMVFY